MQLSDLVSLRAAKDQKSNSQLVNLFSTKREMMKLNVLQFLELQDIVRLGLTCKHIKSIIDPCSCDHQRSTLVTKSDQALYDYDYQPTPKSFQHLKRIAAIQKLNQGESLTNATINKLFHLDIQRISDFKWLDGTYFKEQILREFQSSPTINFCKQNRKKQNVELAWKVVIKDQSILQPTCNIENPLTLAFSKFKIDYNSGGFFQIRHVRLSPDSDQYVDYVILIEEIADQSQAGLLRNLNQSCQSDIDGKIIDFQTIKNCINGIGRIIQYKNTVSVESGPDATNFTNSDQNEIICIYDGQISEGRPHGFGRGIYCDHLKVFTGPFELGFQQRSGRGIQRNHIGTNEIYQNTVIIDNQNPE